MSAGDSGWSTGPPPASGQGPPGSGSAPPLSEWWKRLVALVVDSMVVSVPTFGLYMLALMPLFGADPEAMTEDQLADLMASVMGAGALVMVMALVIPLLYYGILNGNERGQTLGKMIMKIRVRDELSGGPLGIGKGLVRYLVVLALSLPCGIPALIDGLAPLWDPKRQSWHDKAVRSVVVDAE